MTRRSLQWFVAFAFPVVLIALALSVYASTRTGSKAESDGTSGPASGETSGYQRAILADGVVTEAEMDEAVRATVACLQERGIAAEYIPQGVAWAPPTFRVVSSNSPQTTAAYVLPCKELYMSELGTTFAVGVFERRAAFSREEYARRVEACIAGKGYPLDGRYSNSWALARQAELAAAPGGAAAWDGCIEQTQAELYPVATPAGQP